MIPAGKPVSSSMMMEIPPTPPASSLFGMKKKFIAKLDSIQPMMMAVIVVKISSLSPKYSYLSNFFFILIL